MKISKKVILFFFNNLPFQIWTLKCSLNSLTLQFWFKHILFHDFKLTCKTYIHTITIYRIRTKAESLCGSFPSFGLEIEYTILAGLELI